MSAGTAVWFCQAVAESPEMNNATARIGAWLIGAALQTGGFPLELSLRQVKDGFVKRGVVVKGTGSRLETIRASMDWLEEHGYLKAQQGRVTTGGHFNRIYTMER